MSAKNTVRVSVNRAMNRLGYVPTKARGVFRALCSTNDVEHIACFRWKFGIALSGRFGLRNEEAERFSFDMIKRHGGDIYQLLDETLNLCGISFSIGRISGWGGQIGGAGQDSLALTTTTDVEGEIVAAVRQHVSPLIGHILDPRALLNFLWLNEGPCRWVYVNGALRAAQIASLGAQIGEPESALASMLAERLKYIQPHMQGEASAETYVRFVIEAAYRSRGTH